ncbi:MAG: CRISPR-associated helicase Cas3' [Planctomycetes bacterium]|nr:CRISPR-associated helicase Cas3' [Planctomycetota bacterium]
MDQPGDSSIMVREWAKNAPPGLHWRLWGKARPQDGDHVPAHPLLYHMLDVAAVAVTLLDGRIPEALASRLRTPLALPGDSATNLLAWAIALHDFGKATPAFQAKSPVGMALSGSGLPFLVRPGDMDHGRVGLSLLEKAMNPQLGELALPVARAVAAHHGEFPANTCLDLSRRESGGEAWDRVRDHLRQELHDVLQPVALGSCNLSTDHPWFVLVAGLTSVADWIGSMVEYFPYEQPSLLAADYWLLAKRRAVSALDAVGLHRFPSANRRGFDELFPALTPWPLHTEADRIAAGLIEPALIVIEAPMGEGKTEAALTLAEAARSASGCGGVFIGLPTQATANQMLGRVERHLRANHLGEASQLVLAHGEASLVDSFRLLVRAVYDPEEGGDVHANTWFLKSKRTLLAGNAVGTVDQALLGVLRIRHGFVRLTGLAGKVVILDEVHAYDTFTSTLLDRLVQWLTAMGSTVVLLSATLPSNRRAELLAAWGRDDRSKEHPAMPTPYPRIAVRTRSGLKYSTFSPRSSPVDVALVKEPDDLPQLVDTLLRQLRDGGCTGWICNTVGRAQAVTQAVRSADPNLQVLLLHARMLPPDRLARERTLLSWLGRDGQRPHRCLIVGTQVLEQSLDIDFDWLRSDLAPVDLLLQRAGRLHRHRRTGRPDAHASPRLSVVVPDGPWHEAPLDSIAPVYSELVMRRTLRILEGRSSIRLPSDIEHLVECVYVTADPPEAANLLAPCMARHEQQSLADKASAKGRLMPRPDDPDDFLGDFLVTSRDDEDPALHESLRAMTRLGPPAVDAVCLHLIDGRTCLDAAGSQPIDLEREPTHASVDALVRCSVSISRPDIVAALLAQAPPGEWRKQPLLRHRRPLAFVRGIADIANCRLMLDEVLGLVIERRPR